MLEPSIATVLQGEGIEQAAIHGDQENGERLMIPTMDLKLPEGCASGLAPQYDPEDEPNWWSHCSCGWHSVHNPTEAHARLRLMLHRENLTTVKHPMHPTAPRDKDDLSIELRRALVGMPARG